MTCQDSDCALGDIDNLAGKLQVDFDTTLDLAPYMSDRRSPPKPYQLYGVLVHQGHSVHSGHYFCFVRAANGLWHQMNDNSVSQVSIVTLQGIR